MNADLQETTHQELILGLLVDGGPDYVSGEALSGKLGLSRTAVWKVVNALRRHGYRIEAVPSRGYRLLEAPDRLTALEVLPLLETHDLGRTLHAFETVDSTNVVAFRLAVEGAEHGELVVAETQTNGRGRRGRRWSSPGHLNLYCSFVLRPELPPQRAPELTLLTAVAVAESLRAAGVPADIKWPNDLLVAGRKVAGILTELSADLDRIHFVVVGIGINLNAGREDFPPELAENPDALRDPAIRERVAKLHIQIESTRLLIARALSKVLKGEKGWPEVPLAKLQWGYISLWLAELALDVLGPTGTLLKGAPGAIDGGMWARNYVWQRYTTIGAGPTEVQKNIIADRALKLER